MPIQPLCLIWVHLAPFSLLVLLFPKFESALVNSFADFLKSNYCLCLYLLIFLEN